MKNWVVGLSLLLQSLSAWGACRQGDAFVLLVHGGAGSWEASPAKKKLYVEKVKEVLQSGYDRLRLGGSSLDTVQQAIQIMEDSGILNAGKGAVHNLQGVAELDASIMNGKTLTAGAVAAVKTIKNPIHAARVVMEQTKHVLLAGPGAEQFAGAHGVTIVDPSYFQPLPEPPDHEYGTVGAVALDCEGNLAAGTSTGGLQDKLPGRIGDSPLIGSGTYANNLTCAVSATGTGEFFIRQVVAHDISAMMEYRGLALPQAARAAIDKIGNLGGDGGVIAVDKSGNVAFPFNTPGMLHGYVRADGVQVIDFQ